MEQQSRKEKAKSDADSQVAAILAAMARAGGWRHGVLCQSTLWYCMNESDDVVTFSVCIVDERKSGVLDSFLRSSGTYFDLSGISGCCAKVPADDHPDSRRSRVAIESGLRAGCPSALL